MNQRTCAPPERTARRPSPFVLFFGYAPAGRALLMGLLLLTAGCEESVDPIIGTDIPFAVWGFMNAGADTQRVRVFPVSDELIPRAEAHTRIDARVYSTDLTTGRRREWTYKAVAFDSLITGHVFWAPFRAEHEHRYRLEVVRSDGETSSVRVTMPPPLDFEVEVERTDATWMEVRLEGDVPHLIGFRVTYNAVNNPPGNAWPIGTPVHPAVRLPVTVPYEELVRRTGAGWTVTVDMQRDFAEVKHTFESNCLITKEEYSAPHIWLRTVEFSVLAADSSWAPPGGEFNINVLAQPGAFSNVENGYGFFGAGQAIRYDWSPSVDARLNAGYNFGARCSNFGDPTERPDCMQPPIPCIGENAVGFWENWLR